VKLHNDGNTWQESNTFNELLPGDYSIKVRLANPICIQPYQDTLITLDIPCCFSDNIIYVNQTATGAKDGTSWADAYTHLQDALDNHCQIPEIWVAKGTYKPTKKRLPNSYTQKYATFYINDNIKIYGGFTGTETTLAERDLANNETILSGNIGDLSEEMDTMIILILKEEGFIIMEVAMGILVVQ